MTFLPPPPGQLTRAHNFSFALSGILVARPFSPGRRPVDHATDASGALTRGPRNKGRSAVARARCMQRPGSPGAGVPHLHAAVRAILTDDRLNRTAWIVAQAQPGQPPLRPTRLRSSTLPRPPGPATCVAHPSADPRTAASPRHLVIAAPGQAVCPHARSPLRRACGQPTRPRHRRR